MSGPTPIQQLRAAAVDLIALQEIIAAAARSGAPEAITAVPTTWIMCLGHLCAHIATSIQDAADALEQVATAGE